MKLKLAHYIMIPVYTVSEVKPETCSSAAIVTAFDMVRSEAREHASDRQSQAGSKSGGMRGHCIPPPPIFSLET